MKKHFTKREFLATTIGGGVGLGAGLLFSPSQEEAIAQAAPTSGVPRGVGDNVTRRKVSTTLLFEAPFDFPNALEVDPDGAGLWIGEQAQAADGSGTYGGGRERNPATLVDWNGNLIKTVATESVNTSGMGIGGGYIWMVANRDPQGVFQTDMNSRTVSHRQIPLGGGGNHGATYHDGKLWLLSTRMRAVVRVDPVTWDPEYLLPLNNWDRLHDVTFDDTGALWVVVGTYYGDDRVETFRGALAKYDVSGGGRLLEYAEFSGPFPDPHGLAFHDGAFYSTDAGIHPGWPEYRSPNSGYVFRIDLT